MHTHHLFYPEGISLFFANYYYYGILFTLFLRDFLGLPLIYNLLVMHTFIVAGLGAFWLVHELTGDFKVSLLGGFIFSFNPSHFAHALHHLTIASIQTIPFFVLFLIRVVRGKNNWDILWASFFMVMGALCDWNYLVFNLLFIALGVIYLILRDPKKAIGQVLRILWVPGISFICLAPLILPMLLTASRHAFVKTLTGHNIYVADVLGFFIPHVYHLLSFPSAIRSWNSAMTGNDWEKAVYLGTVNLVIVLVAARWIWRECRRYFLALLAFMILAMGAFPHILGRSLSFPLPYRLIQEIPFLTQARCPSRIIVYAYLFLAILVAFSVRFGLKWIKPGFKATAAFGIVFLLVFFDYYSVNAEMTMVKLPVFYKEIQKDPEKNFGILDLPWEGARYMMYQTIHGIPCVQGYMGRRVENVLSDRLIYDMRYLDMQKKMLVDNHVKYIVIHKQRLSQDASALSVVKYRMIMNAAASAYARTYETIYNDEDAAVFKVY